MAEMESVVSIFYFFFRFMYFRLISSRHNPVVLGLHPLQLDVPVIALSQLSRSVEARRSNADCCPDLRESWFLEQDADIVALFIS